MPTCCRHIRTRLVGSTLSVPRPTPFLVVSPTCRPTCRQHVGPKHTCLSIQPFFRHLKIRHSQLSRFVHLQLDNGSNESLTAKLTFNQYAAEHGVKILHYHCNNGRFHNNAFQQACHKARQQLTFCGAMPTFKMALPSKPFGTSQKAHGSICSTCAPTGWRRSTLLCGLMPCGMQPTFTTTY
jgi:hypothetical protein